MLQETAPPFPVDDPDEELWEELLQFIEEGRVVPIVGRDLLVVEAEGQQVLLYNWLAERLSEVLGVPFEVRPDRFSLNTVASRYLAGGGEPEKIYYRLHKLLRSRASFGVPEPLKKLASIQPFRLFVTTTFDSLLVQAINEVRFGGVEYASVLAYSPREKLDLPGDITQAEHPMVFHLLGKLSPLQDYVVTEEDALEFVHSLQSGPPVNLFTELGERPLLFLGCSFPAWLVRPLIRTARRHRLLLARGKTDFVVDALAQEDTALLGFLKNFKTRTQFFQRSDPVSFIDELHRRWTARVAQTPPEAPLRIAEAPAMAQGAIFLSYASEDRPAAQAIRDALDRAGMDVWFDRDRLWVGDAFESKIRRNIERCSLFVPILSRACVTRERRFFRLEWDHAQRVAITAPGSAQFLVPIVIDDLPPDHEDIPERFRALHWQRLPGGVVTPEFVDHVRGLYRDHQNRTLVRT